MKNNFPIKKLGEVCDILIGGTPRRGVHKYWNGGDLLWVSIADLTKSSKEIIDTKEKITKSGVEESNAKLIPKGTLLFSFKLSIGKLAFAGLDLYTNEAIAGMVIKDKRVLDKNFLYYFLQQANYDTVTRAVKGNTLNKEKIKNIQIHLPPLEIQKKIVERVEKLMGKIDEAKKLRKEATADASALIPSALHKIFEEGKKKEWKEKTIGEISEKTKRINPIEFFDKEFSYIDITAVSKSIDQVVRARILPVEKAPSRARNLVKEGDIIFATTRPYLKNIIMIPKNLSGSVASTGFCVIRPNKKIVDPSYIYYLVDSEYFLSKIIPLQRGATYPAVSDTDIYNQKITLPPLSEQRKIVKYLDSLSERVRKIKTLQSATDRELKLLEKSVLNSVFAGKL